VIQDISCFRRYFGTSTLDGPPSLKSRLRMPQSLAETTRLLSSEDISHNGGRVLGGRAMALHTEGGGEAQNHVL